MKILKGEGPIYALPNGQTRPVLPPIDPNQRYTVAEASAYLRQSIRKTYLDITEQRLKTIKDGRYYLPGTEIIRVSTYT